MIVSPNKDETAVYGCQCQGDMAVRMRKVLQTAGLVFECVTCFFRVSCYGKLVRLFFERILFYQYLYYLYLYHCDQSGSYYFFLLLFRKVSPVSGCTNITLKSGVHVYPPRCLTSNQDYGSTCTFNCFSGYQLSGSASIRCGFLGAWSEDVSAVSCNGLY